MDGATLQSKVYGGYARAAARVGNPFTIYRPASATNPLQPSAQVGTILAAFTPHGSKGFDFGAPSDWKNPAFHALLDPTQIMVGDYLVAQSGNFGPFFISSKDPSVPVLSVQCNRVVSVWAQGAETSVGLGTYGGNVAQNAGSATAGTATETAKLVGWPASILMGARGHQDIVLPGNDGSGMYRMMLPPTLGVAIKQADMVTDDLGNRFAVLSSELQDLGWRVDIRQVLI